MEEEGIPNAGFNQAGKYNKVHTSKTMVIRLSKTCLTETNTLYMDNKPKSVYYHIVIALRFWPK